MRKYWLAFTLALQTEMQYRANLVMWLVVGAIGPLLMTMVWFVVLGGKQNVGGYTHGDFIVYYLLMTFGFYIIGGEFARPIGRAIKNGDLNRYLLRPYSLVLGCFSEEQAWKLTSIVVTLPALLLALWLTRGYITLAVTWVQAPVIVLSVILAAIIFALLQAIIGSLAFWVTEIWPFAETLDVVSNLFGGLMAPIALMPGSVQRVTEYLPFRYMFYEPITMILGKANEPMGVIGKQVVFIIALSIIFRLVWRVGTKRYEGIGG